MEDNGPGIPDYALEKIFDKFFSLPRPKSKQKSSGLGLSFVKRVMDLHNGSIRIENKEPPGVRARLVFPVN